MRVPFPSPYPSPSSSPGLSKTGCRTCAGNNCKDSFAEPMYGWSRKTGVRLQPLLLLKKTALCGPALPYAAKPIVQRSRRVTSRLPLPLTIPMTMESINRFLYGPTPEQRVREWQSKLRQESRVLDREMRQVGCSDVHGFNPQLTSRIHSWMSPRKKPNNR